MTTTEAPQRAAWIHRSVLAGILGLATLLRGWDIGRDSLWLDEAQTAVWSKLSPRHLLEVLRLDVQSPVYHLLMLGVSSVTGSSEAALRWPSAVAGILTVLVAWVLARRTLGVRAAHVAALLIAVSPMQVHYGREARCYALLSLAFVVALLAARAVQESPTVARAVLAGVALLACFLTHGLGPAYAAGAMASGLVSCLSERDRKPFVRAWAIALGVAVAGHLPWVLTANSQVASARVMYAWHAAGWEREWPWQIARSLAANTALSPAPLRNAIDTIPWLAWLGLGVAAILAAQAWRRRKAFPVAEAPLSFATAALVPLVVIFGAALATGPIHVVGRVDSGIAVPLALLAGAGLVALSRPLAIAGAALLVAFALPASLEDVRHDTRSQEHLVARDLERLMAPDEELILSGVQVDTFSWYLGRERPGVRVVGFPPERAIHPCWVDWKALESQGLDRVAGEFAESHVANLAEGRSEWVLATGTPGDEALLRALAQRFESAEAYEAGYLSFRVVRFSGRRSPKPAGSPTR